MREVNGWGTHESWGRRKQESQEDNNLETKEEFQGQ